MRCAALLGLVIATQAVASPLDLPSQLVEPRSRSGSPVMVFAPSTPVRKQTEADLVRLYDRANTATGITRVDAIDALTSALENRDLDEKDMDLVLGRISRFYGLLLEEPALELSPFADELLIRGAKGVGSIDPTLAMRAAERLLAKYPASPFAVDAHLLVASELEIERRFVEAKPHLLAVISSGRPAFVTYARLRLGWMLHVAGDHALAIDELARLALETDDVHLAEAAIDTLVAPYAHAGRADLAAALFDHFDRSDVAGRLRRLAGEYAALGKDLDVIIVLRDAIARDREPTELCLDRADIVAALARTANRTQISFALAELAEARPFADATCKPAADMAIARAKR